MGRRGENHSLKCKVTEPGTKMSICKPGRKPSPGAGSAAHDWEWPTSRTVELSVISTTQSVAFVLTAWADYVLGITMGNLVKSQKKTVLKINTTDFFFLVLELELRAFTLSHSTSPFCDWFFQDRILWTICTGWFWTGILPISASWVARITGVRHWCPAISWLFK
jgi:hypothetical protein